MLRCRFITEASAAPGECRLAERYSIMLSSTYRELIGHREAVRMAMLSQGLFPLAMEEDAALPGHTLISASLAKVDAADGYVGLISYRYGQMPVCPDRNPDRLSLTELEFRRAVERQIPICMFIMHDDHPIPRGALNAEPGTKRKLTAFIARAKANRIYAEFRSEEQLKSQALQSLEKLKGALDGRLAPQPPTPPASRPVRSNIAPLGNLPFVGRDVLLSTIAAALGDPSREAMAALHGTAGVGKSELAREFARRHGDAYPGGTFMLDASQGAFAVGLARLGQTALGLDAPAGMGLDEQALRTLAALATQPTLLIYDNVAAEDAVDPWLPAAGSPCHVVVTSTLDRWDARWRDIEVPPLSPTVSQELIGRIAGADVAASHGARLAELAGGLPVQIVPAASALARAARRGRLRSAPLALTDEAQASFLAVYRQLDTPSRLLLHAAARLDPQRIPRDELRHHLAVGAGWSDSDFERRLDACLDIHALQDGDELRMHQLFAAFLRETPASDELASSLPAVARAQAARLTEVAREVADHPNRADLAAVLLAFVPEATRWADGDAALAIDDGETVGRALYEIGRFAAARPWFERAVAAKEQGDAHGRVDHASLGRSLHLVGYCLSSTGEFAAARPWFERAVAEKEPGDAHGRVDHASLGRSLHQVGDCLARTGEFAAARPWFERAVAEKEQGDVHGRVDHESLGRSLHSVGHCLSRAGEFAAARPWFERAVAEAEQGDVHGRVDHASLGRSLHQVGHCLSSAGEFAAARPWFERAVAEAEQGDVHGRVDHASLGISLHQVGHCLSSAGEFAAARPWFERAVAEAEQGDMHGRVDHASLGRSLHQVGHCLSSAGEFAAARPWFERAVAEKEQGDMHGRVDHASLAVSLDYGAYCLRQLGQETEAQAWAARAAEMRR